MLYLIVYIAYGPKFQHKFGNPSKIDHHLKNAGSLTRVQETVDMMILRIRLFESRSANNSVDRPIF